MLNFVRFHILITIGTDSNTSFLTEELAANRIGPQVKHRGLGEKLQFDEEETPIHHLQILYGLLGNVTMSY